MRPTVTFAGSVTNHLSTRPLAVPSIKRLGNDQIAYNKAPKHILIVDEFPMTVTGKIQKFIMREKTIAELQSL